MLQPLHIDPTMSAYKVVHGPYNWNCFPLAPPGCKAVIYKSPEARGSWGSHRTGAWYTGFSLDHYQCNYFFVPDTRAYQILGSAELFPQHCQVPFLLWNEHLQKVSDKLVTTLREMRCNKRAGITRNISQKMSETDKHTGGEKKLTCPAHEWLLPQGDLQRVPLIPITEQMEQQRVIPPHTPTLQHVTEAPPIMAAPNPTTKCILKLTKRTQSQLTRNNTPGSVPAIMQSSSTRRPLPIPIPTLPVTALLRQSPQTAPPLTWQCIPRVRFQAIPRGVHNFMMISQEAINFLTKCIWAQSPNIYTPNKLCPTFARSCVDYEQLAMPMVHPTTGEAISSYKRLMHNPATSETWQTAFGKDFGGMAQDDEKTGQKGKNSIFVMTHDKIAHIPRNQTVTYA
jgi:hypothetical protein